MSGITPCPRLKIHGPSDHCSSSALDPGVQRRAAGAQQDRVERALDGHALLQPPPERGRRLDVEAHALHPGLGGVAFHQGAAASRKADDRDIDAILAQQLDDPAMRPGDQTLEVVLRQQLGPAFEKLQGLGAGSDLHGQIRAVDRTRMSISPSTSSGFSTAMVRDLARSPPRPCSM